MSAALPPAASPVDLPEGAAAEALRSARIIAAPGGALRRSRARCFAPYGENEVGRPALSARTASSAPTTSARTCSRRLMYGGTGILVIALLGHRARHGARASLIGVVAAYGGRLVGRGDHAPQRRAAVLPADPAGAARAHRHRPARRVDASSPSSASRTPRASRASRAAWRSGIVSRDFVIAAEALGERRQPGDRGRGAAEHERSPAGRGRPAADLLHRPGRASLGFLGFTTDPGARQLGADDQREPAGAGHPALGGAGARAGHRACSPSAPT